MLEPSRAGGEPPLDDAFPEVDFTFFADELAAIAVPSKDWAAAEPSVRLTQQEQGKRSVIPSLISRCPTWISLRGGRDVTIVVNGRPSQPRTCRRCHWIAGSTIVIG